MFISNSIEALSDDFPTIVIEIQKTFCKTEKWSKIVYFVFVIITPVFGMLPNVVVSLYLYYVEDFGRDAFEMPIPAW